MKLLIDTNVVLDLLLKREPFYQEAAEVLKLAQRDGIQEYVSASAITDIYYIAHKMLRDSAAVRALLQKLLMVVSVAAVSQREIFHALELAWGDFEDCVQYSVAFTNEMDMPMGTIKSPRSPFGSPPSFCSSFLLEINSPGTPSAPGLLHFLQLSAPAPAFK